MKKSAVLLLALLFAACTAPSEPTSPSESADQYFFPSNDNTYQYTYSQDKLTAIDTTTYRLRVNDTLGSFSQLIGIDQASQTSEVLLYFKNQVTADGTVMGIIAETPGDKGFVALQGTLDLGASWFADPNKQIEATVVGKYAEYYLPGRAVHYNDVVVVKYANKSGSADNYTIRYFARNYGLIMEQVVTGPTALVSNLQLLSRQGGSTIVNPDPKHDRWYNATGRYSAHMRDDLDVR
ncbi:MAG: hypothetical protein WCH46_08705 [bacterium]